MSGHTPGPWVLTDSAAYGNAPYQRRWTITAADPDASPSSGYKVQVVALAGDAKRGREDGHLIASAPDMLAALRGIQQWADYPMNPDEVARRFEAVAAAIAKAEGNS